MSKMKITPITAALIGGLIGSAITYSLTNRLGDSGMSKKTRVADEKGLISLTPCLGSEFGKTIEIEGTIVDDTDTRSRGHLGKELIEVYQVDDMKLANPVVVELSVFSFTDIKIPTRGTTVKYRGYETGGFSGIPMEAFHDIPRVATTNFYFERCFQITKRLNLEEAE
jgi:hypothetical protein